MNLFSRPRRLLALGIISLITLGYVPERLGAQGAALLIISEVHPSGSSNGSYGVDWIEITNIGTAAADIAGWRVDDNSNAFASAVALRGIVSIPAGKSAVFFEGAATSINDAAITSAFSSAWFGTPTPPAGVLIGAYGGSGVGLSGTADAVNLFDSGGARITGVSFGAATAANTFDNAAGIGASTLPLPSISMLSAAGVNGAFTAGTETGSPGRTANPPSFSTIDLSTYIRIGRFPLPEPIGTPLPPGTAPDNLLAQEASAVTYNWDTDTLFITGDGGKSVTQVTRTGQLIDTMTLADGSSPQGTDFFDPEGITYIGNGQFVMSEERDRQAVLFTYAAGTTLTRAAARTVDLGTFAPNTGLEGLSYDPATGGFIFVKEIDPQGIFHTDIDFDAGTATNGSPTTVNSTNLFDPALLNALDLADVFALSNLPTISGPGASNLLVLSQESARIFNVDRFGNIASSLTIPQEPGSLLTPAAMQHEGLTMDGNGILYVVNENGGGDIDHPELWVYAPSLAPNQAPTGLSLANQVTSIPENSIISPRRKVADVIIADDGLGVNTLTVFGVDAASFEVDLNGLYLRAGTNLDFELKPSFTVGVAVDDANVGASPDATTTFILTVTDAVEGPPTAPSVAITEVAPWGSGNSPYAADWFELTNTGSTTVNVTGWRMDDTFTTTPSPVNLTGISNIGPGESVIFMETNALDAKRAAFMTAWFGVNHPPALQIGSYSGGGVGLSTGGDAVNIFDTTGAVVASVTFLNSPAGPSFPSFDNSAALNNVTLTQLSVVGVNGAFAAVNDAAEIGSPGGITGPPQLIISEVAPWSSGNSPVGADWFEVTNIGASAANITGWKVDDNSESPAGAALLNGITSIAPGESVIFLETSNLAATRTAFIDNWFGDSAPPGLQIGSYSGSGLGLGTGGDAVSLFNQFHVLRARVNFGAASTATPIESFDNAAGINFAGISQLSVAGINGAFTAVNAAEVGSPGTIFPDVTAPTVTYTGNAGIYRVDQSVSIQCVATDASGIASTDCSDISGPAWSFDLGLNEFSATATDVAGNVSAPVSTSFTVTVSFSSLQALVRAFSSKPLVTFALNVTLGAADHARHALARAILLRVFELEVRAQTGRALTPEEAAVLIRLSRALQ